MKRWILLLHFAAAAAAALAVSPTGPVGAQATSTAPATSAATGPASGPATTTSPAGVDPKARAILDALEKAGERFKTIQADVDYLVEMREVGDTETRTGAVTYERAKDANSSSKFKIQFDTLSQGGGKAIAEKVEYAFDGQWVTVAKHKIKQMIRYQVAAKDERVEPLKIGKGPFPLPFGQKAEEVIRYFEVTTRATTDKEPKDTDYMKLTTRPERRREINFKTLEMWVDRKTALPVRIVSDDRKNTSTVDFRNVKTDVEVKGETFLLPRPPGWELTVKRLGED